MANTKSPTPEELNQAVDAVDKFDTLVQNAEVFNQPLTKSERALLTTFYVFLQRKKLEPEL